jgi:hypothetical protein
MPEEGIAGGTGSPGGGSAPAAGVPDFGAFRESLGDLGKDKAFEPIKDFNGLAKSFVEAQKMIGGSIRLPKKDGKPEERQKAVSDLLGKLRTEGILEGAPEAPDKYDIKFPSAEEFTPNEPLVKSFREAAHKLGVTPTVAQGLFDWYLNFQAESESSEQREFEEAKSSLKKDMGGLYVRKMESARRAVAKYLGADGDALISNLAPKAAVRILKAFAEIGDPLLEEEMVAGELPGVITVDALEKKVNDMMFDKKHPLNDLSHPLHMKAVEEYTKLTQDLIRMRKVKGGK